MDYQVKSKVVRCQSEFLKIHQGKDFAKFDGTRRRLARHRYGRLIRKGTERIGKRLEVGVLGGEHGDEEEADEAAAHAKCLRVRPRKTCETGRSQLRVNEWFVSFFID